jgi:hypothetical protein
MLGGRLRRGFLDGVRTDRHEQAEAARTAKNPKSKPKPYKENPWKNEPLVAWDGDENKPAQLNGTTLTVPVERHNYRLLIVESK